MRRSGALAPAKGQLFLMNHFHQSSMVVPGFTNTYETINSYAAILNRTLECEKQQKRWPNFIAVDFVEEGENGGAKQVVWEINTKKFITTPRKLRHDEL
jgi:hypothetical protein